MEAVCARISISGFPVDGAIALSSQPARQNMVRWRNETDKNPSQSQNQACDGLRRTAFLSSAKIPSSWSVRSKNLPDDGIDTMPPITQDSPSSTTYLSFTIVTSRRRKICGRDEESRQGISSNSFERVIVTSRSWSPSRSGPRHRGPRPFDNLVLIRRNEK